MNSPSSSPSLSVVVLAAGKGTRMKSARSKLLHEALGRPLVSWAVESVRVLEPARTVVVVGYDADTVSAALPAGVTTQVQERQRGSGDALAAGLAGLQDVPAGDVLVVNGDSVLFTPQTLHQLMEEHRSTGSVASALGIVGEVDLPYGRVVHSSGDLQRIVEARDAQPHELAIRELNAGLYCFDIAWLRTALPRLNDDNSQGELYVTELFEIARHDGKPARAVISGTREELLGVNTCEDLAEVTAVLQRRIVRGHQLAGVTFELPETCVVEPDVQIGADARILPGTILRGSTRIASNAVVGPNSTLVDTVVEEDAQVLASWCLQAQVGPAVSVGPFAYLRPGADLRAGSKIGTFVEIKKSVIGPRSKVPHLSYVGDATVGCDANVGAGNITANYRPELGSGKQRTVIGDRARTGSDNVLVAPVTIGEGAFTGAGSIITEDVPAGALAIARARQTNIPDYAERLRERGAGVTAG